MSVLARWRYTTCSVCGHSRRGCRRGVCRLCASRAAVGAPGRPPRSGGSARASGSSGRSEFRRDVAYDLVGEAAEGVFARLLRGIASLID